MRILVTGGTGFIGRSLCSNLLANGHDVAVLTRSPDRVPRLLGPRVAVVHDLQTLREDQPLDAIISLAGAPIFGRRWSDDRKQALWDSRVGLTEQLIDYIRTTSTKPRVLLGGSAIGYYGSQGDRLLDETSDTTDDFSHRLCAAWEEAAARAEDFGVRVCRLRTGLVLGPHGGLLQRMLLPFRLGLGGRLGDGRQWMSWIHLDDHVRAIVALLTDDTLSGAFNFTAPNPVTNAEFTATLARLLHRPALCHLPAGLLRLAFGEMAELLLGSQRVIPRRLHEAGFEFLYPSLEFALNTVIRPR